MFAEVVDGSYLYSMRDVVASTNPLMRCGSGGSQLY